MIWENKCLNVWVGGTRLNNTFYNCRITNTGCDIILIIQKDGKILLRETYNNSSVDDVKIAAETFLSNI